MEELWVIFAREHPIRSDESVAGYLRRFYEWCAESDEAKARLVQLEQAVASAHKLLVHRRLLLESGRPTEFATREERDLLHSVGRAFRGEDDERLDEMEVRA